MKVCTHTLYTTLVSQKYCIALPKMIYWYDRSMTSKILMTIFYLIFVVTSCYHVCAGQRMIRYKCCRFVDSKNDLQRSDSSDVYRFRLVACCPTSHVIHLQIVNSKKKQFFKARITRYSNRHCCATFQLRSDVCIQIILLCGDVHCNPGPVSSRSLGHRPSSPGSKSNTGQSLNGSVLKNIPVRITSRNFTYTYNSKTIKSRNPHNFPKITFEKFLKPTSPFSCYMINARSVKNKVAEIRHYILDNDEDMLIITETWLSSQDNVVVYRLVPDGYEIKHQAREHRRGGGVAIVYKSSI